MDKTIKCVQCSEDFNFSEKEQAFFREKQFNDPKRCLNCRRKKRESQRADRLGDLPINSNRNY